MEMPWNKIQLVGVVKWNKTQLIQDTVSGSAMKRSVKIELIVEMPWT